MSWIRTISEADATGLVKEVYEAKIRQKGSVGPIRKVLSLKPELLAAWDQLANLVTFGGSRLGRRREELIAVVCSAKMECSY